MLNSDPAVQSLTVDQGGTSITWLRNGTMPEIASADFAFSTDGVTYTPLGSAGAGTRLVGGWRVTGVNLPVDPNLTLRCAGTTPPAGPTASGSMIEWIVPASDFNIIENGDFTLGLSGWLFFATPDMSYIVSNVTSGVLNFYRVPPPPGTTQSGRGLPADRASASARTSPLVAQFDLGNSSTVRKRISVLVHDSDFSDLSRLHVLAAGQRAAHDLRDDDAHDEGVGQRDDLLLRRQRRQQRRVLPARQRVGAVRARRLDDPRPGATTRRRPRRPAAPTAPTCW